jgi:hypothetical protein
MKRKKFVVAAGACEMVGRAGVEPATNGLKSGRAG